METLLLDRQGIELDAQEGRLLVRHPDPTRSLSLPVQHLQKVLVLSPITLNSRVIALLAKHDVACVFADTAGTPSVISPLPPVHAQRVLGQVSIATTPQLQQKAAQGLIKAKVLRQKIWLENLAPQIGEALGNIVNQLHTQLHSSQALLGYEGAAARLVWQFFAQHFSENFGFTGRNRRPPKDPVNSVLSLSATLARHEAVIALRACGLDPFCGIFHVPRAGRESLAWDMVELVRPRLEEWTFEDFSMGKLTTEHFSFHPKKGCKLVKCGRITWFSLWAERRKWVRRYLLRIARQWGAEAERLASQTGVTSVKK